MTKETYRQAASRFPSKIMKPYDVIYDEFGYDVVSAFIDYFGGMTIYVPRHEKIFLGCVESDIKQNFTNLDSLAVKYGYSKRHIRRLAGQ